MLKSDPRLSICLFHYHDSMGMRFLAGVCVVSLVVGLKSLVPAAATQTSTTTLDGVYTMEQAKRGEEIYRRDCALCHRDNLLGNAIDGGPPLRGPQFTTRWTDFSIETMLATIAELMPVDDPGSLSRQEYVDVVGFVLWANQLPAGEIELPTDPGALDQIVVAFP